MPLTPHPLIAPGFVALHGNRLEDLADAVWEWTRAHPLAPLEDEVVLTQSRGMAEWFRLGQAQRVGVSAAVLDELPSAFAWRLARQVLGPQAVPRQSPLDKLPLTWRLVRLLPTLAQQAGMEPLAQYLQTAEPHQDAERLLQLASQLADLLDQYQNFRGDWLSDWAAGRMHLRDARGKTLPLAAKQHWQALLWQALVAELGELAEQDGASAQSAGLHTTRPYLQQGLLEALHQDGDHLAGRLPRRVIVFGMSHLPLATLELLGALSRHSQVLLTVPNPCRYYWGDIIADHDLLKAERRRHAAKPGSLALAQEDMHQHAHPLLAAWGRQSRDFVRLLDQWDDAQATQARLGLGRIDFFDDAAESPDTALLQRIQQRIRDLVPLAPGTAAEALPDSDRSVVFAVAHSPVRELEALHDHLLGLFDQGAPRTLQPRDIVVMLPDVSAVAPAISAVFGQYPPQDERHIPYAISDLSARAISPVVQAVEWLLTLRHSRCALGELINLLEVPAVAQRFGIAAEQLPQLTRWMDGAGIRWGLSEAQRSALGVPLGSEHHSARFGLRRMLLGYATGNADIEQGWNGCEPYREVGGLDAELAGALWHLIAALESWWAVLGQIRSPQEWGTEARAMLKSLFAAHDDGEQQVLDALEQALTAWLDACALAQLQTPLGAEALRRGWMDALDLPGAHQRYRSGGVTFCTLMPMRAIPFKVVCLLGMNDGDYPRRNPRSDFDLMAASGQFRPGDRARALDDRQLMLEALLSARRQLYISWAGHSVRDNSEQPPSVLVAQLRDYIAAVWGEDAVKFRTTQHPLQPFSQRYFAQGSKLTTYAREWQALHQVTEAEPESGSAAPTPTTELRQQISLRQLLRFFKNPVKAYFQDRLGVRYQEGGEEPADHEHFGLTGLEQHGTLQSHLDDWPRLGEGPIGADTTQQHMDRQIRSGVLPLRSLGELQSLHLRDTVAAMARGRDALAGKGWRPVPGVAVAFEHEGVRLLDWVDGVHRCGPDLALVQTSASKLTDSKGNAKPDKLLEPWLQLLALATGSTEGVGSAWLIGQDAVLQLQAPKSDQAKVQLQILLALWSLGQAQPLPLPLKTALAVAEGKDGRTVYEGGNEDFGGAAGEVSDRCLARVYPDYDVLRSAQTCEGQTLAEMAERAYRPLIDWAKDRVSVHPLG